MNRFHLVDGSNYLYRGFYAVQGLKTSSGIPTGAIKGCMEMLLADWRMLQPGHAAVVFDMPGRDAYRYQIYPQYKGNRRADPKMQEIAQQVHKQRPVLRQLLKSLGVTIVQKRGFEGDDILGALAVQMAKHMPVYVSTGDKDIYQLVGKNIFILPTDRKPHGPKETEAKFGVGPAHIVDYLMLIGDKTDNIPGIDGCGPKTAAKWLKEYGSAEAVLKAKPFNDKQAKSARKNAQFLRELSRQLVTIDTKCLRHVSPDRLEFQTPDFEKFAKLCKEYELRGVYRTALEYFEAKARSGKPTSRSIFSRSL